MAPPKRPWFRFYVEAVHDRKLRRLTPTERWLWVAILAAARQSPVAGRLLVSATAPMDAHDLADWAAVPVAQVRKALPKMIDLGMLHDADGCWVVSNFTERQFESDQSTNRVARHREATPKEQRCNGQSSPDVTPPETETETETDTHPSSTTSPGPDQTPEMMLREDVARVAADMRRRAAVTAGVTIAHPDRWTATVRQGLLDDADWCARVDRLADAYPTARHHQLADAAEGRTEVLRYLPREA